MYWLYDSWDAIIDFLYLGGNVLRWIAVTIFLMWVLILERLMYFRSTMAELAADIKNNWEARGERRSWHAQQIREGMISRFEINQWLYSNDTNIGSTVSASRSSRDRDRDD